jgi:ATP-binding protein involved in chromosome partitioning
MVDSSSLPQTNSHLPSENPNSVEKLRQQEVVNYLKQVIEPTLKNDIISLGMVRNLRI